MSFTRSLFEIDSNQFDATYAAFLNAIHPDDRDAVNQAYSHSLEIRLPYDIIHRLLMSDGRIKWVHERCTTEFDGAGKGLRSIGTVQDITGRNLVHFFDPTLDSALRERAVLDEDLRQAIDEQQFLIHYQAQVVSDGRLTGVEALVRWQHPARGMVSPAEFIPLAEENGLIVPLGYWVLKTACVQLVAWAVRPEFAHLTVAVNVSAHQFHQVKP